MVKISVIMPVYNAGAYLAPAIESVLGQTLRDLELIIVDDVSTDGSLDVARGYAARDSRVRVMAMENNGGPGIARNRGIEAARSEYLGFMDSDDLMPPDAFQNLYDFAAKENLDIARGAMADFTDSNPEPWKVPPFSDKRVVFSEPDELRQMALCTFAYPVRDNDQDLNFGGSACSAIFRLSLVNEASIRFEERPHTVSEDYLFCYKCLIHGHSAGVIPEIVYHYRTNPASRSHRPAPDMIERALKTAEEMDRMIVEDGFSDRDREYAMRYAIDIVRAFLKNFFLSGMPLNELKEWFHSQRKHPFLHRCRNRFPLHMLPKTHRISFEAFYEGRFWHMFILIYGREFMRKFLKMQTTKPSR